MLSCYFIASKGFEGLSGMAINNIPLCQNG